MMGPPTVICERDRSRSLQDRHDVRAQIVVGLNLIKTETGVPRAPGSQSRHPYESHAHNSPHQRFDSGRFIAPGAESGPKSEVLAAAKKLAGQKNYGWTTTVTVPKGAMASRSDRRQNREGRFHVISMARRDTTTEAV